jgi:hypothetical protein
VMQHFSVEQQNDEQDVRGNADDAGDGFGLIRGVPPLYR